MNTLTWVIVAGLLVAFIISALALSLVCAGSMADDEAEKRNAAWMESGLDGDLFI